MEFFNENDFELLSKFRGEKKEKGNPEHQDTYDRLKETYKKTEYWAEQVVKRISKNAEYKIVKKPTNQGNTFEYYHWVKIYPDRTKKKKEIAFTLGISAKKEYVDQDSKEFHVKIDTVSLNDNNEVRKNYLKRRGDFYQSDIVKTIYPDEVFSGEWDYLIDESISFISKKMDAYYGLQEQLFGEDNNILEEINLDSINLILYGPPGTGKTYSTIEKSVGIIDPDFIDELGVTNGSIDEEKRRELKIKWKELIENKRVKFTTFHQSLSYEDFIEGIKPKVSASGDGLKYEIEDGIFQEMTTSALKNLIGENHLKEGSEEVISFDQLYKYYLDHLTDKKGKFEFSTIGKNRVRLEDINTETETIFVKYEWDNAATQENPGKHLFRISKSKIKTLFEAEIEPKKVSSLKSEIQPLVKHTSSLFYAVYKGFYDFVTKKESIAFDEVETDQEDG